MVKFILKTLKVAFRIFLVIFALYVILDATFISHYVYWWINTLFLIIGIVLFSYGYKYLGNNHLVRILSLIIILVFIAIVYLILAKQFEDNYSKSTSGTVYRRGVSAKK